MLLTGSYFKVGIIAQCSVKDGRRSEFRKYVQIVTLSALFMYSCKTGSAINSYIAHFLSEINEAEVAGKQQIYSTLHIIYIYIFILFHIILFIVINAFYNMKLKIFGCFINSTAIRCRHE